MIKYYERTREVWPELDRLQLHATLVPFLCETLLNTIGYANVLQYHIRISSDNYWYDPNTATLYLAGPTMSIHDIIHEVAHHWALNHDKEHFMAMALLVELYKERR